MSIFFYLPNEQFIVQNPRQMYANVQYVGQTEHGRPQESSTLHNDSLTSHLGHQGWEICRENMTMTSLWKFSLSDCASEECSISDIMLYHSKTVQGVPNVWKHGDFIHFNVLFRVMRISLTMEEHMEIIQLVGGRS